MFIEMAVGLPTLGTVLDLGQIEQDRPASPHVEVEDQEI